MTTANLVGRLLGGVYRIEAELGAGGMGTVYAARHERTGRPYAVKVLKVEVAARGDAMDRFAREAEAVGALHHANVVAIHDFHVEEDLAYLVMDRLEGEDLAARLKRLGALGLPEALRIAEGMAAGLAAAHARGMVHRDLKPANVFLAQQPGAPERPVLLDFGLAKSLSQEDEVSLTASGLVMGTPRYMSPEQASGLPVDARADLYALATVVYEMLAGRPPFEAPTVPALFVQLATAPPPPIRQHRPDLSGGFEAALTRALAKDPGARFPTADALLAALCGPSSQPTPVGNHAASWPKTPSAPVDAYAATAATPTASVAGPAPTPAPSGGLAMLPILIMLGVFLLAAGIGTAGFVGFYFLGTADTNEEIASAPPAPAPVAQPPVPTPPPEPEPANPVQLAPTPVEEATAPPDPAPEEEAETRRRRVGPRRARPTPAPEEPAAEPSAPAAPAGPPAGGPPAGVREATDRMAVQDWRGCIRETHQHPRSAALLGARFNCALRIPDNDEMRSTCAEIRQHYPQHGYNQMCDSIMRSRGISR